MPNVYDNIESSLLPALRTAMTLSERADFCVGYFNLRGWKQLDAYIEHWSEPKSICRLLVGMQKPPHEEFREATSLLGESDNIDNQKALRLKKKMAQEFRQQLIIGAPNNEDEIGLRILAKRLREKKLAVKLYLRHPLHAKLYLAFRSDPINPIIGYLGSSNLTMAGMNAQGELNVDVLDSDATQKLSKWFEERWNDRFCIDISQELIEIIDESWAREELVAPYHIYIKMAYHLAQEAREGLTEFAIPAEMRNILFPFQEAAVKIASHHIRKRGGVLLGDVVGLGKTLMATAIIRIFEQEELRTLILCPRNLVPMWEDYRERYGLRGKVLSLSRAIRDLPEEKRYQLVLIDESHNLRNRESKTFRAVQEYIHLNDSKCLLLTATPYNKVYSDLSNQLRLFLEEDQDLGIRPEKLLKTMSESDLLATLQKSPRTLAAFENSPHADDWRDLMRLYLVRRTRSFIQDNYALTDKENKRKYLEFADGRRAYFPKRVPKTLTFEIDDKNPEDQYARLYSKTVVDIINDLELPRYGLGNYIAASPQLPPTPSEQKILQDLSRAGKRLKGFCRTNLFKRLESSGVAFLQSIQRHILRNYIFIHAIENSLPLPIGSQSADLLDSRFSDADQDGSTEDMLEDESFEEMDHESENGTMTEKDYLRRAAEAYSDYQKHFKRRFKWLNVDRLKIDKRLAKHLRADAHNLMGIISSSGQWDPDRDTKLIELTNLLSHRHPNEKVLIFTQFADTVHYLEDQLQRQGFSKIMGVSGLSANPTALAWRFSPVSNQKRNHIAPAEELRVLVATDVLSEGQNLQDCSIVVNFDLPWALIRLIQRAGRVDRIGQQSEKILCYSFLPADGVEKIIHLRTRVTTRLHENAEVVGSDEAFFEDQENEQTVRDLFTEKAGILDSDDDREVDLASYAYQIWKNAIQADPDLQKKIEQLPDVILGTKPHPPATGGPEGVLLYMRTPEENDALAYVNKEGESITESQFEILKAAECAPNTRALSHHPSHHELVKAGVELIVREEKRIGGQLGSPRGARFRTYGRLKHHAESLKDTLFQSIADELNKALEDIYKYPLRQGALDTINRQLKAGIDDAQLADLVNMLRNEGRLSIIHEDDERREPRIICSMGIFNESAEQRT